MEKTVSRYAKCPGLECQAKVKIIDLVTHSEVNFCCLPCWEFTWQSATLEDGEPEPVPAHSGACWMRQELRYAEPVVEGKFKIHTLSGDSLPPSRLGGSGGRAL